MASGRAASSSQSSIRRSSPRRRRRRRRREIVVGVLHRARQDVELIVQLVERRSGDHQLAVAELELVGPLARHPVPLPAALRAELARPAATTPLRAAPGGTTGSAAISVMTKRVDRPPRHTVPSMTRWFLHVDLDQFLAAVEVRRHPELRGRPVVVGGNGDPTQPRQVVATASYEARAFGVHSGMPLRTAARRCPDAVFLPSDKPTYEQASAEVMDVLRRFPVVVEVWGWDEAAVGADADDPEALAIELQRAVLADTGLHCSIGIGDNKLRAKTATAFAKPAGRYRLTARQLAGGDGRPADRGAVGRRARRRRASSPSWGSSTVRQLASRRRRADAVALRPDDGSVVRDARARCRQHDASPTSRGYAAASATRRRSPTTLTDRERDRGASCGRSPTASPLTSSPTTAGSSGWRSSCASRRSTRRRGSPNCRHRPRTLPSWPERRSACSTASTSTVPFACSGVRAELTAPTAESTAGSPVGQRPGRRPRRLDPLQARRRRVAQPLGDRGDDQLEQRQRADVTVERRV